MLSTTAQPESALHASFFFVCLEIFGRETAQRWEVLPSVGRPPMYNMDTGSRLPMCWKPYQIREGCFSCMGRHPPYMGRLRICGSPHWGVCTPNGTCPLESVHPQVGGAQRGVYTPHWGARSTGEWSVHSPMGALRWGVFIFVYSCR